LEKKNSFLEKLKWLDPFTYVDILLEYINPKKIWFVNWAVNIFFAFIFAFILYSFFGFLFGTSSPFVIVLSGSMEPTFYRGDIMAMSGANASNLKAQEIELGEEISGRALAEIATPSYSPDGNIFSIIFKNGKEIRPNKQGDIVVYYSSYRQEPIIHRAVAKIRAKDGIFLLTKGDSKANYTVDQDCGLVIAGTPQKPGCINLYPVNVKDIQGKVTFKIPLLGYVKLLVFDDVPVLLFGCNRLGGCPLP
jgi:signal peptidase I